jgi:hypothetical protein
VRRAAAVARLIIIGARAVARLVALSAASGGEAPRLAALQALEGIGDPRGLTAALQVLPDQSAGEPLALAAVAVVRACLPRATPEREAMAIAVLAAVAFDVAMPHVVRHSAREALAELAPGELAVSDERMAGAPPVSVPPARGAELTAGIGSSAAEAVRAALAAAHELPLPTLHRLLADARARERDAEHTHAPARGRIPAEVRQDWMAVRGAAHQVLASRRSRLGLCDLRETLQGTAVPLPVGFLAAVTAIGDESCLEPLAAAWSRSSADQIWWRDHLAEVFRTIVRRERITRRHAAIKRILRRWPEAASALLSKPSRSTAPNRRGART